MKKFILPLLLLLPVVVFGQGIDVQPRHVIDIPTAWPLPRAGFDLTARAFGQGGMFVSLSVGVSNQFMFGASYGGTNILGEDSLQWNRAPGLLVRYNIIPESFALPAISIGFESQGYGPFIAKSKTTNSEINRYTNKSPGFYVVASKSYAFLEHLDFHGGINYSLERGDGDKDINLFTGAALAFNQDFELLGEYDFALNDTQKKVSLGEGTGYLNAGLRLNIKKVVYIEVYLKNLLQNRTAAKYYNREFQITFFQYIL
ncbi:MAG: hypothetical protein ALAOOOJD_01061 [bacterium]|nr:hypothetical protein [bacterium]